MGFSTVYKKLIFKEIKKAFRITCIMLILEIFKNEEIRNHHSRNFNSSYFMGHTMDVSWLSNWKLKPCFPDSISPLLY